MKGPLFEGFLASTKFVRFPEIEDASKGRARFDPSSRLFTNQNKIGVQRGMANGAAGVRKASCENCFFNQNMLCAVAGKEACATFRPYHPEGLRPPQQLRFVFRQERSLQVAWAFPSANEQIALHS